MFENSPTQLKHAELTDKVLGTFYEVYNELGHGFIESVYENSLAIALREKGHEVFQQVDVPVWFRGTRVGDFDADILVDRKVILELKSARAIDSAHLAQLMNYLRATEIEIGLLLNFGPQPEFKRLAFDNSRKRLGRPSSNSRYIVERIISYPRHPRKSAAKKAVDNSRKRSSTTSSGILDNC